MPNAIKVKVYTWGTFCAVLVFALGALSLWLIQRTATQILTLYFSQGLGEYLVFACCISAGTFYVIHFGSSIKNLHKTGRRVIYTRPNSPGWELALLAEDLCLRRNHALPDIVLVDEQPKSRIFSVMAGMIDRPVHRDVLIIGRNLLASLLPKHLQGVLAHELRHSNAIENFIFWLIAASKLWVSTFMFLGGIHFIFFRPEESSLGFFSGVYSWLSLAFSVFFTMAGPVALLEQAMSRYREYKTDALGALDIGNPDGLAETLQAIDDFQNNQMSDEQRQLKKLFEGIPIDVVGSHPATHRRIRMLERLFSKSVTRQTVFQAIPFTP